MDDALGTELEASAADEKVGKEEFWEGERSSAEVGGMDAFTSNKSEPSCKEKEPSDHRTKRALLFLIWMLSANVLLRDVAGKLAIEHPVTTPRRPSI